ncbi:hypothetical protein K1T71_002237 [Dendrolimus kikuchii]|uniref:Uncharacterized protein n=1 Tax=Dendrolimus kikuchii TaxID=765133 RepID=A0ACC1DFX7_9NEOP|nr:hypothetical protein K1T71_002237 [Dendrolimus kikuchii]
MSPSAFYYVFCTSMEHLASLNAVVIRQKSTAFSGNKYVICAPGGGVLFYAKEDAGALNLVQGSSRAFNIDIFDADNKQASLIFIQILRRPYTFGPDKMDVKINGSLVSVVRVEPTFMKPVLNINDADDKRVLRVKGPMCQDGEVDYEIFDKNKTRIGCIQKQWSGIAREVFTDADNFMITFPGDLDVRFKAAVIGTCLLIVNFYYYFSK